MQEIEILKLFQDTGAILDGHFILSSGLHSERYVQCALLFQKPHLAEKICSLLAQKLPAELLATSPCIVSPALGGIIFGYELARQLGVENVFVERLGPQFALRRGFSIRENQNCIVAEDVVTTGGSTREVIKIIEANGGHVAAIACLINRSGHDNVFDPIPCYSLLSVQIKTYAPHDLPPHLLEKPAVKHGSRHVTHSTQ